MCHLIHKNMKTTLAAVCCISLILLFSLFSIIKFSIETGEQSKQYKKTERCAYPGAVVDDNTVVRLSNLKIESLHDNHSYISSIRYPYVAAILAQADPNSTDRWRFSCFGCVILPSWILSSAHCQSPGSLYRALLFHDYIHNRTWTYPVVKWTVHAGYDPNRTVPWHDIALAKLNVKLNLPDFQPDFTEGVQVFASIWKTLNTMDRQTYLTNDLDIYSATITDPGRCYEVYGFTLDETLICVDMMHSDCFTNEFGPLYTSSQRVLGVLRLKPRDCDIPVAIFTNVSSYSEWIKKETGTKKGELAL